MPQPFFNPFASYGGGAQQAQNWAQQQVANLQPSQEQPGLMGSLRQFLGMGTPDAGGDRRLSPEQIHRQMQTRMQMDPSVTVPQLRQEYQQQHTSQQARDSNQQFLQNQQQELTQRNRQQRFQQSPIGQLVARLRGTPYAPQGPVQYPMGGMGQQGQQGGGARGQFDPQLQQQTQRRLLNEMNSMPTPQPQQGKRLRGQQQGMNPQMLQMLSQLGPMGL